MAADRIFWQKAIWIEDFRIWKHIGITMKHKNVHKKNSSLRYKVFVNFHIFVQTTAYEGYTLNKIWLFLSKNK